MRFGSMEEACKSLENRTYVQLNDICEDNNNCDDGLGHYKQYVLDTDTFFDDLSDWMAVSVMVNESVTKGVVKALSEEANEVISAKDIEIDNLHKKLKSYEFELLRLKNSLEDRYIKNGSLVPTSSSSCKEPKEPLFMPGDANHSEKDEYLQDLGVGVEKKWKRVIRVQAKEKWQNIMREMAEIRMFVSGKSIDHLNFNNNTVVSKLNSFSYSDPPFEVESVSCNLDEASASSKLRMVLDKVSKVEEELVSLRDISDKVFQDIYDDFMLSEATSIECQWMWKFQQAVNAIVIQDFIQCIQEHSEEELQKRQVIDMQHDAWLSQLEAISSLHEELENISQSLFGFESGSLLLHGSHETHDEEANGSKRAQRKIFGNHVPLVHQEHNVSIVSYEESTSGINVSRDAAEFAHLKHMPREELISHFKAEMLKMNRDHESKLHAATEKYYQFRRELLKDSLHTRKDKDLEGVKNRILKVIEKLDKIMKHNVKFSIIFDDYRRTLGAIDKLTKENGNLKNVLRDRKKEISILSSQVFDARQKLGHQSSMELSLLKQIQKYKSELEEYEMKGFVMNDVCITALTVLKEFILGHECGVSDSGLATIISHEFGELILEETVKDAHNFMKFAMESCCETQKLRYKFESLAEERGQAISVEMQEKEKLKRENEFLLSLLEVKKKLELETMSTLIIREEELNIVSRECDTLRHQILQLERLIVDSECKLATMSGSLELASQELDKSRNDLEVLEQEHRISLERAVQEKQQIASIFLEKEREHKKQLEVLSKFVMKCLKEMTEFEQKMVDTISLHNLRLWKLHDTLRPVIQLGNLLRNRGLSCKKIFLDLQKAEVEVDLLGDEVDSLLNVLEKTYFTLDHYSPVLKYYPGIMEILKLVNQELSGGKTTPSPLASQHELDRKR